MILADLTSPLMLPRIAMLKELPYKKYILHNANNLPLTQEILQNYEGFEILVHRQIGSLRLRYVYSFFYTLYLLIKLNPKLIVVHWASRLYQNLLLALWGRRVIVHTMGGDIDNQQDCKGKKRFFVMLLLKCAKVVSVKSLYMMEMLEKSAMNVDKNKIVQISFGVEDRFFHRINEEEKYHLQQILLGQHFDYVFFSARAFNAFYHAKEIIETFIKLFSVNSRVGLIVSLLRKDNVLWDSIPKVHKNIIFAEIQHQHMDRYLLVSDCVVSYSKSDGLSQSIMESMANGKFIIINVLPNYKGMFGADNALTFNSLKGLEDAMYKAYKEQLQGVFVNYDWLCAKKQQKWYLQILKERFNV